MADRSDFPHDVSQRALARRAQRPRSMERSTRQISAVQRSQSATYDAYDRLVRAGIPRQRIAILSPGDPRTSEKLTPRPKAVWWKIVIGALIGAAWGASVGALVCVLLWAFDVNLFLAQPWVASFVIVAYAANAGALVGGLIGTRFRRSAVAAHVQDEVDRGRWVVVVNARDREQRELAEAVLGNEPLSLSRAA